MKVNVEYLTRKEKTIEIDDKYKELIGHDYARGLESDMVYDIYKILEKELGEYVEEVTYVASEDNNAFMYDYRMF